MTYADEIRAAADRLREAAEACSSYAMPWTWRDAEPETWPIVAHVRTADDDPHGLMADVYCGCGDQIAAYIALMHPGVGSAVADWLTGCANDMTGAGTWSGCDEPGSCQEALKVARVINGEASS